MSSVFLALLFCYSILAQKVELRIVSSSNNLPIKPQQNFNNVLQCKNYLNSYIVQLQSKGFITAAIDSITEKKDSIVAQIFLGQLYNWQQLSIAPNLLKDVEQLSQYSNISVVKKQDVFKQLQLPQQLLQHYQNTGYPFATVGFDSVIVANNNISAVLIANKGAAYNIDSIRVFGTAKIGNNFLQHYLNIFNKTPYSLSTLTAIDDKLQQLPYFVSYKNSDITLLAKGALVNLYLQPKNLNRFDAIVGFLPANQQLGGKLLFTVDAKLNLQNAFAGGEALNIMWQQIQPQSPRIEIGFEKPYFLNSKFGLAFNFNLYKRDLAFLNVNAKLGITIQKSAKNKTTIFLETGSSRIIEADTLSVILNKQLPAYLDMSTNGFGVQYQYSNTNNAACPTKGFELEINLSSSIKKIIKNTTITNIKTGSFNYAGLYDSLQNNNYNIKLAAKCAKYFNLNGQGVFKTAINTGWLQTPVYLQNEQFRIGGFKLLRGFDEENIFTNAYAVASTEYRYIFAPSSYFFGFIDGGFATNSLANFSTNYIGTGIGMALQTKQGILNISFAVGKRGDLPFSFKENKIHIGLLNNF